MASKSSGPLTSHFSQEELDLIIRTRFLTAAAVPKGEPPFKRLIKRFSDFIDKSDGGTNVDSAEDSLRAFLRELNSIELSSHKMRAIIEAQHREQTGYERKQEALLQQIEEVKKAIENKKGELIEAREIRQQLESCEGPRGKICDLPARTATMQEQQRIASQMSSIEAEGVKYTALIERKKKAISRLLRELTACNRPDDEPSDIELVKARALTQESDAEHQPMELEAGEMPS